MVNKKYYIIDEPGFPLELILKHKEGYVCYSSIKKAHEAIIKHGAIARMVSIFRITESSVIDNNKFTWIVTIEKILDSTLIK